MFADIFFNSFYFTRLFTLKSITCFVHISERMADIMDKVTIKEEISIVDDTCTVYVVGDDVKEESTENQGMGKHFLHIFFFKDDRFLSFFRTSGS